MPRDYGVQSVSGPNREIIRNFGYSGIYFFGWEGDPEGSPIKVGVSDNPFVRFASMQIGNWRPIRVHEILWLQSRPHTKDWTPQVNFRGEGVGYLYQKRGGVGYIPALEIERHCHKILKGDGLHYRGEWYNGGVDALVRAVKTQISDAFKHECYTHKSMLRRLKMWKEEAALDADAKIRWDKSKQHLYQQHGLRDPAESMRRL